MYNVRIAGLGHHLPERVMTNLELEALVDTSDQWIQNRTGIRERRIAAPHETSSSLGLIAAQMALEDAGIAAADIDLVVVATSTPDGIFPSVASLVQAGLGATRAGAFDVNSACASFISALATGLQFVAAGSCERVLVIGAEVMSRIVNWQDRNTCVLFGDGAGALVLERAEYGGLLGLALRSDGTKKDYLFAEGPCGPRDEKGGGPSANDFFIRMDGPATFKFAVQAMTAAVQDALGARASVCEDIDVLVAHQANLRIIQGTAKHLGIPEEKALLTVQKYGNTSSASIPVTMSEGYRQGRFSEGDIVALCAFGGGLSWGSLVLEYSRTGLLPERRRTQGRLTTATFPHA